MPDLTFALGTFSRPGGPLFVGLVLGREVVAIGDALAALADGSGRPAAGAPDEDMVALLSDWERRFDQLRELAEALSRGRLDADRVPRHELHALSVRPPVPRPSKILNSAANYSGHLAEMRAYTQTGGTVDPDKIFRGDKSGAQPYLFLKAPSALIGAFDDIELPSLEDQIDWEAELALVIGRRGRRITAEAASEHIAGYMTFNDVSCRNRLFREDRPNFRTDWLSSKSFDGFAPAGPFLVPSAFVPDATHLRLELSVNGEIKQEGLAGDMIYSPQEQIAYASAMMTLEPGDIFATGTVGGVGQGSGVFLKPGDIVETEIQGLGRQRNRVVLDPSGSGSPPGGETAR